MADEDGRVRGFVVERGPGLEVHPVEGKLSLRASPTGNLHLAAARGAVLPGSGGLKSALQCLTQAREVRSFFLFLFFFAVTKGSARGGAAGQRRAEERAAVPDAGVRGAFPPSFSSQRLLMHAVHNLSAQC